MAKKSTTAAQIKKAQAAEAARLEAEAILPMTPAPQVTPEASVTPVAKLRKAAGFTDRERRTLEALVKVVEGLTRKQLQEVTGQEKGWSKLLGAVTRGTPAPDTLEGRGLVRSEVKDGKLVYTLTPAGKAALAE